MLFPPNGSSSPAASPSCTPIPSLAVRSRDQAVYPTAGQMSSQSKPRSTGSVEALGIEPDVKAVGESLSEVEPATKKSKLDASAVRKVFIAPSEDVNFRRKVSGGKPSETQWNRIITNRSVSLGPGWRKHRHVSFYASSMGDATCQQIVHRACSLPQRILKIPAFDLLSSLCTCTELIVQVCMHLDPQDIVRLYSVSRAFYRTISAYMQSSVKRWARYMAPAAAKVFFISLYDRWFIKDPAGRPREYHFQERAAVVQPVVSHRNTRKVPGLLWLQMVVQREKRVRGIIAMLARTGHRLPPTTDLSLMKVWLVMDMSSSRFRLRMVKYAHVFTDEDLINTRLFTVKLMLRFNDPIYGPESPTLMQVLLGQRSLNTLWLYLTGRQPATPQEAVALKYRYDVGPQMEEIEFGMPVGGVRIKEMGIRHLEGWGLGQGHLMRPDELIAYEMRCRGMSMSREIVNAMITYGHVDRMTGQPLVPTLEELYLSDDSLPPLKGAEGPHGINGGCGNIPFDDSMWQPRHARKARWDSLSEPEQEALLEYEEEAMRVEEDLERNIGNTTYGGGLAKSRIDLSAILRTMEAAQRAAQPAIRTLAAAAVRRLPAHLHASSPKKTSRSDGDMNMLCGKFRRALHLEEDELSRGSDTDMGSNEMEDSGHNNQEGRKEANEEEEEESGEKEKEEEEEEEEDTSSSGTESDEDDLEMGLARQGITPEEHILLLPDWDYDQEQLDFDWDRFSGLWPQTSASRPAGVDMDVDMDGDTLFSRRTPEEVMKLRQYFRQF